MRGKGRKMPWLPARQSPWPSDRDLTVRDAVLSIEGGPPHHTISAGTLDALPHNGTVLILLSICGLTHRESYLDMVMTAIVSCIIALVAILVLGSVFGSF